MSSAKTASKRVVQKTAEATGDLIGNKIVDKITSIGKPKERKNKRNRRILHSTKKTNKLLMTWDCFEHKKWHHCIKIFSWYKLWW